MLSWGDIQVNSHNHPTYLRIFLQQSNTEDLSFFVCGCARLPQYCPTLSVRASIPGPLSYNRGCSLSSPSIGMPWCASLQWPQLSDWAHHHCCQVEIPNSVPGLLEVVCIHDIHPYLSTAADIYLLSLVSSWLFQVLYVFAYLRLNRNEN